MFISTPDRSCEVEIGKSSIKDESFLETRVKKVIDDLLESADPYVLPIENPSIDSFSFESLTEKCTLLKAHFEKLASIHQMPTSTLPRLMEKSQTFNKRRILQKFTDNSQEDEVFNREMTEIPEKLREEVNHCKQVLNNLLNKTHSVSQNKLLGYLEILYECNLLKIHSDPVCLFIQDEESKTLVKDIIMLTRISNTLKTYMLRTFIALESCNVFALQEIKEEIEKNGIIDDN